MAKCELNGLLRKNLSCATGKFVSLAVIPPFQSMGSLNDIPQDEYSISKNMLAVIPGIPNFSDPSLYLPSNTPEPLTDVRIACLSFRFFSLAALLQHKTITRVAFLLFVSLVRRRPCVSSTSKLRSLDRK